MEINGGTICGNHARASGGGICADSGIIKMTGGSISGNTAEWSGGGIEFKYQFETRIPPLFEMSGGSISNNRAMSSGGGVELFTTHNIESTIFKCSGGTISGNIVPKGRGGGIDVHGGICEITGNAVVSGNKANEYGGGIYAGRGFLPDVLGKLIVDGNAVISGNYSGAVIKELSKPNTYTLIDTDVHGKVLDKHTVTVTYSDPPAWGGGICLADAVFEMRGGSVKGNKAKKGGGVFVGSEAAIMTMDGMDGTMVRPGVSAVFNKTGGEITANSPDDVLRE